MSKIQSESNSQLCDWKEQKQDVVTNMSKIQSESNSQLNALEIHAIVSCDQYVKDTIWKQFTTTDDSGKTLKLLWPICQRYNLKAIHNANTPEMATSPVVTNMSKIQSESNSQRNAARPKVHAVVTNMSKIQSESNSQLAFLNQICHASCDQYVKDTIWKQFTTYYWNLCPVL